MTAIIQNQETLTLFTIATEEESSLRFPLPDRVFGFLAQQSCEKLLKALLSAHSCVFPFTHILLELTNQLSVNCSEELPAIPFALGNLQPFAVQFRYGSPVHLSETDRTAIRKTVAILRAHTLQRILTLQSTSPQ